MGLHPFRVTFRKSAQSRAPLMWTRYGSDCAGVLSAVREPLDEAYPGAVVVSVECLTVALGPQGFLAVEAR